VTASKKAEIVKRLDAMREAARLAISDFEFAR
jgi:hypothetical protein